MHLDDPTVVRAHFSRQIREALESGTPPDAREVQGWVERCNVSFDPSLAIGVLVIGRDAELSEVLRARTPGIERFDPVQRFVTQRPDLPGEFVDTPIRWPASSFLLGAENVLRYHSDAAFDDDLTTSWAEGRRGAGIGDSVIYRLSSREYSGPYDISIFPGFGTERDFRRYNRLRQARIEWYTSDTMDGPIGRSGSYLRLNSSETIEIPDEFDWIRLAVPAEVIPESEDQPPGYVRIVIEKIYSGSDRDDTCIAEIRYHPAEERP